MPRPAFYSCVNRWECDENDHLNVRFYSQKMHQTLMAGLLDQGLVSPAELDTVMANLSQQHMRYIAEARVAAPMTGLMGLLEASDDGFTVLTELRHTATGQVQAAYTHRFEGALPGTATAPTVDPLPDHAGSRGLASAPCDYRNCRLETVRDLGFVTIGRGVITPDECRPDGTLMPHLYLGRVSDTLGNLWAQLYAVAGMDMTEAAADQRLDDNEGGAALEYHMTYHAPLRLNDRFEICSGVRDLGGKTMHFVHLMFDVTTGDCVMSSEAIAIAMDLKARRAKAISPGRRAVMEQLLLAPPP